MFIAMNHFKVTPGREADFEESWRNRRSSPMDAAVSFSAWTTAL